MRLKYCLAILTCSVLIIFTLYQTVSSSTVFAKGESQFASVAGIEIVETNRSDIQSLIAAEVAKWKKNDIIVQGTTSKVAIPSNYITFNIKETVNNFISQTSTPWYNFWGTNKKLQLPIELSIDEDIRELLNEAPLFFVEETIAAIKEHASFLKNDPVQATEVPLTKDLLERVSFEIQDVVVDGVGVSLIVDVLNETVILNNEKFSFLETLSQVNGFYSDETANFVASTLYSVILQSQLEIQERHSQHVQPEYLQPGIEVNVNKARNLEFSFINQTTDPIILSAEIKEGRLVTELYSFKTDYEITYNVINKEEIKPRIIYRLTADLPIGTEKVLQEGKEGLRVQVYKIRGFDEKETLISKDFYPPENKIVLVSSLKKPVESTDSSFEESGDQIEIDDSDSSDLTNEVEKEEEVEEVEEQYIDGDVLDSSVSEGSYYDKGGNLITSDSN